MTSINTQATTLESLKIYLDIQDTQRDSLLQMLIESCSEAAEKYLGRSIVSREFTQEPHDLEGLRSKYVQLEQYPVTEIIKIMQDGIEIPLESLKTDKYNGIIKKSSPWTGVVMADYKAGLAASTDCVPKNIQLAIWQWIADILHMQDAGGAKSESLGDYSINYYDECRIPQSVELLLESYRRISI